MTWEIEVRLATEPDEPVVLHLMDALIQEDTAGDAAVDRAWAGTHGRAYVADLVARPGRDAFVATSGGVVAGVLVGVLLDPTPLEPVVVARLGSLYVEPPFRGHGVGSALVEAFLAWAGGHGAPFAQVSAYSHNAGAIRFYQRHGLLPHHTILRATLGTAQRAVQMQG